MKDDMPLNKETKLNQTTLYSNETVSKNMNE